jgi:GT2 family glycosyltransferase
MPESARVRVVVVNYNGGDVTLRCVNALRSTDWPADRFEIVVVDNASTDGLVETLRRAHPDVGVIALTENRGFAAGCNAAMRSLGETDAVALVNPDTVVTPDWLRPLVDRLGADRNLGAACPKILLASPYRSLSLDTHGARHGRGRVRLTGVRIEGVDVTASTRYREGWSGPDGTGDDRGRWAVAREAGLVIPSDQTDPGLPVAAELRLRGCGPIGVEARSGSASRRHQVTADDAWYPARLGAEPCDLVNSTGVAVSDDGFAADRGYLEPDTGQYDNADDVDAWSGAAVLLRREYLDDVGLLDERLFLYYEDVDHSLRGRERGWRFGYTPDSVVRHAHSTSTVADSALSTTYNERNRLLVLARHRSPATLTRAVVRYVVVTLAYARRDLQGHLGFRCVPEQGRTLPRARVLGGFLARLAPMLLARRRDRQPRTKKSLRSRRRKADSATSGESARYQPDDGVR